jgi:predicted AlkP superfamily pyrophosphatase or phosphodiesterase
MKPKPNLHHLLIAALVLLFSSQLAFGQSEPTVLLVSFDGFRHDYIDKYDLPNFKAFRAAGASAEGLVPCYPSLTFPNHYSIVTGQRPSTHGLVDNSFYDSALDIQHSISKRATVADERFYGGTPLWMVARAAGMKTASYFWVGTEVNDPARRPDIMFLYDSKVPFITRVDTVLNWLRRDDATRPRFITLYFYEPDHTSHESGPEAPETQRILHTVDSLLGYMMEGIKSVKAPVNTILVSDHGMSDLVVADETFVFLDELYDVKTPKVKTVVSSTLAHLYIDKQATIDSMYNVLSKQQRKFKVYKKSNLPPQWHYNHYRVGDIVVVAEPYHYIRHSNRQAFNQRAPQGSHFGVHGFDPGVVNDMRGIFMAQGPQVKKGLKLGLVRNIDIYPLMATILKLKIPPIDGDAKALREVYVGK